jgi:hypothetical protein
MIADELPNWRETTAEQAVVEFIAAVTDRDSPDFVPERDGVAVFDNDGTSWTEQPMYAQLVFALDGAAELGHPTSLEELHAGGMAALGPDSLRAGHQPRPGPPTVRPRIPDRRRKMALRPLAEPHHARSPGQPKQRIQTRRTRNTRHA